MRKKKKKKEETVPIRVIGYRSSGLLISSRIIVIRTGITISIEGWRFEENVTAQAVNRRNKSGLIISDINY
jgi:hypothetical protein